MLFAIFLLYIIYYPYKRVALKLPNILKRKKFDPFPSLYTFVAGCTPQKKKEIESLTHWKAIYKLTLYVRTLYEVDDHADHDADDCACRSILYIYRVIGENILRLFFCSRQFGLSFAISASKSTPISLFCRTIEQNPNSQHTRI